MEPFALEVVMIAGAGDVALIGLGCGSRVDVTEYSVFTKDPAW